MRRRTLDPTDNVWAKGLIHCYVCGLDVTGAGPYAQKYYSQQRPGVYVYVHSLRWHGLTEECEAALLESAEWGDEHPLDVEQREFEKAVMKGTTYYEERK